MTPQEIKARELLNKINNQPITSEIWDKASDYAKSDLKRKALIVVDELIKEHTFKFQITWNKTRLTYWQQVKAEIEKL